MSTSGVKSAAELLRRHGDIVEPGRFELLGRTWDVLPGVYAPNLTHSAALYAEWVPYPLGGRFCDLGCGTGYIAVTAAQRGCARVTASDVSPEAAENTRLNVARHDVADRVEVRCGDMFEPFAEEDRYDVIFWNSNFVEAPSRPDTQSPLERAFFDPGYAAHEACLRAAHEHLAPNGRLLLGFSDLGDSERLADLAKRYGWTWQPARSVTVDAPEGTIQYQLIDLAPARSSRPRRAGAPAAAPALLVAPSPPPPAPESPREERKAAVQRPSAPVVDLVALLELADFFVPLTLRAVAALGVADAMADAARSVEDLAATTSTHAPSLYRALRALASKGVVREVRPGTFALAPMGELLRSDHPLSVRTACAMLPGDIMAWSQVEHSLRTGDSAFPLVHGRSYWDYLSEHPEEAERFDRSMESFTRLASPTVLGRYDWASAQTVVDVGGGNGTFLGELLVRHRHLRGVVFDQPHVVAGAHDVLEDAGVADRCHIEAGNFFQEVPEGHDIYVLKLILHDWEDDRARDILRAVRRAMRPGSRLLVIDALIPDGDGPDPGKLVDLQMLVLFGGRERTRANFDQLLASVGLRLARVVPTKPLSIIEAVPRTESRIP